MEKIVVLLRTPDTDPTAQQDWCARLRGPIAVELLDLGLPGLTVNVKDAAVRQSMMTLTTLDPPVTAVLSIWTQQHYGSQLARALELLGAQCTALAAYLVTESVPLALPSPSELGTRTPGLANVALLRRPAGLAEEMWRRRWHIDHTPVALQTQATVGYTQNAVVRPLTPDAPPVDAIVEEVFPDAAVHDLMAFFGAADDADLADRIARMVASTSAFGANENIDTVPTSRYLLRSPFGGAAAANR